MSAIRIASRYAKSLIDLAQEQGNLEGVLEDIKTFKAAQENRDFYLLLKSPIVNTDKKIAILKEIFSGKISDLTLAFLNILTKKGRESYLPEITNSFISQYKDLKSISTVTVTTATPMTDSQLATIKNKLSESDLTLDNIDLNVEVDEDIIGGFVIEMGDKMYNASVAHRLQEMKKEFAKNEYIKSF